MSPEILKTKEELRNLVDEYAYLSDEKKISEQMLLFTPDATYQVYMSGQLVSNIAGTDTLEKEFMGHAALVKMYFTLNGQHTVKIDGDIATGISYTQIKMVREADGKSNITDYSVKYEDKYVRQNGKWLINARIGYFLILEVRPFNG